MTGVRLSTRRLRAVLGLVLVGLAIGGAVAAGVLTTGGSSQVVLPESPAQEAGVTESHYIDQTSLSEVPGRLVIPVAVVDSAGNRLPDSASIIAALNAKDGKTVMFESPTIVDFGHVVAGAYTRPGATADPVSDFPGFFRSINPGETGELTLANNEWYAARYVQLPAHVPIGVVGFRFESDPNFPPATLAIPGGKMPGAFLSSDPQLTRMWYSAASTMQLSMMTTTPGVGYEFYDSPERDRSLWLWYDSSADNTAYYAFGQLALPVAMRSYEAAQTGPGKFVVSSSDDVPDQNGFTERDLAALYTFYADPSILTTFYSSLLAHEASVVSALKERTGLYRTNILPVPPSPVNPAKPSDQSLENQLWDYAGFLGMAELAEVRGDQSTAAAFRAKAAALEEAVDRYLWDPAKGAFVDFVGSTHVDEAGNSMAVMYGLATTQQATRILDYMHMHNDRIYDATTGTWGATNPAGSTDFDRPFLPGDADFDEADWSAPYTQWGWEWGMGSNPGDFSKQYNYNYSLVPWGEAFEVQADFTAGQDAAGIDLIERAWGTMLRLGPSTFYEASRYDGTPAYELGSEHDTVVHRWASGVGALLQQYVLGIEPTSPGFKSWRIEPHGGTLTWVQGRVPTPEGPLSAWWRWVGTAGARRGYTMVVSAPSGTLGEVALPVPERGVVVIDGKRARTGGAHSADVRWDAVDSRLLISDLGAGNHVIKWTPVSGTPVGKDATARKTGGLSKMFDLALFTK
jgi:hypothetical protein